MSLKMSNGKSAEDVNVIEDKSKVSYSESGGSNLCKSKQEKDPREDFSQGNDKDRLSGSAAHRNQPKSSCQCTEEMMKEQTIVVKKKRKLSTDPDRLPSDDETKKAKNAVSASEACGKLVTEKVTGPTEPSEVEHCNLDRHMDKSLKGKLKNVTTLDGVDNTWMSLVKWKKIIKRTLKNAPDGSLRIKQLQKSIFPSVLEIGEKSGLELTKSSVSKELEKQIQSRGEFIFDGKKVRLAP
ncbi:hypothetical protein L7F22_028334 [Adiantum nelumboides]|nr:hypothetical protein [Adiantum nelumboides]